MNNLLEKDILDNLKTVIDPSQNDNIVDLGLVKDIQIKKNNLLFAQEFIMY